MSITGAGTGRAALRLQAEALAHDLPGVLLEARRLSASAPGAHGRRQAGPGEAFWQFRDHRVEDGARLVDWRRSARGERLYVREREREAAQSAQLWLDPDPGFAWRGGEDRPLKRDRAAALILAAALVLWRAGERVGALGGPVARSSPDGLERLADALYFSAAQPEAPTVRAGVVFASDGYAPLSEWRERLETAAGRGGFGAVLLTADPAEEDFPFAGRTEFQSVTGPERATFGRAEDLKIAYAKRLEAHLAGLARLCGDLGFALIRHRTDKPAGPALSLLLAAIARR